MIKHLLLVLSVLIVSMNVFAHLEHDAKTADDLLNTNYQLLISVLDNGKRLQIKDVQLSWISYRDKTCDFEVNNLTNDDDWLKTSIGEVDRLSCITRMTKQRAEELETYYKIVNKIGSKEELNAIAGVSRSRKVSVHVIGVYEGDYPDGASHSYGFHPDGRIDVTVKNNPNVKSYILVLTSYEPVNWYLHVKEGANVDKIILSGSYPSKVTGIDDIPIIREKLGIADGKNEALLKKKIIKLLGYDVDSFQSAYSGKSFDIY